MIARKDMEAADAEKQQILDRLLPRMDAVMRAREYK